MMNFSVVIDGDKDYTASEVVLINARMVLSTEQAVQGWKDMIQWYDTLKKDERWQENREALVTELEMLQQLHDGVMKQYEIITAHGERNAEIIRKYKEENRDE